MHFVFDYIKFKALSRNKEELNMCFKGLGNYYSVYLHCLKEVEFTEN